ncbi:MAG: insulinase family protein [Bacteriovoracaceae bacterium]|nr:insulinase family protein [Bacteriovoracaceae bacterium]
MQVEETLLGDLRTLFIHSPGSTASTVQMWFRAGSALENHDNQGIAHFLEHMFFKGTPTRPGAAIAQEVETFGGEINAFTSFDYTCYYINAPARKLSNALTILLDMVANPMFKADDFPAERDVVFEEYRRALDNPSQYNFLKLQESCFEGGYKHPILGREDTIKKFSQEQIKNFRESFYNPQNAMLVVAGDLAEKKSLEQLVASFKLPHGKKSDFEKFTVPTSPKIAIHEKPIRQATLTFVIPAPDYVDETASAEDLGVNCLAHGETSRLYQALVAQSSICNGIAGSTMYFANGGCHMLKTNFPVENLPKVLKTFEATVSNLLKGDLKEDEVNKIKNQYVASKVYERESIEAFAFSLGHGFAQNGDIFCEEHFINRIKETPARQVALGLPHIFSRPMHITMQVPENTKTKPIEAQLKSFQTKMNALAKKSVAKEKDIKKKSSSFDSAVSMVEIIPGVQLIHRQNKMTPTFVLHHYTKGGITTESINDCGRHGMLSRLITYGYKGMPYSDLKEDLEAKSASLSGFSGKNAYGLTMHGQSRDFDSLLAHFAGTLLHPTMPEKFFKHERQVILRMLDNQKEDPVKQAFKNWYKMVFNGHPYSLDASGTPESLKKMTPKSLTSLHKKHMSEELILFTYCGDSDLETVIAKMHKAFGVLKPRKGKKPRKNTIKPKSGQILDLEMKREQVQIVIGKPAYKMTDIEDLYLKMITAHLSGQGSELFVEVRDKQGLCYAVQPVHVTALESGAWGIYIGAGADKKDRAKKAILDILNRLSETGITKDEFERVKSNIDGQQQMAIQTNEDYAQFYSVPALHGYGLDFQHNTQETIRDATYENFQKFLQKFMKGGWNIVSVGPS